MNFLDNYFERNGAGIVLLKTPSGTTVVQFAGLRNFTSVSVSSRGLVGIATLLAQSLRALAQYTFVM